MPYSITQDIERVPLPRELLEEPPYSRAEKLIAEMYEEQDLAQETKLDVAYAYSGLFICRHPPAGP